MNTFLKIKSDQNPIWADDVLPLSDIMENQPTINIGTIGHVSHGKSTLVKCLSSKNTGKFSMEQKRNLTIKLGYASFKIYKCDKCNEPDCYQQMPSKTRGNPNCPNKDCDGVLHLMRHFSIVDNPGHNQLLPTMLNGASTVDCAMFLISANERCPMPQSIEHLAAAEIMNIENIVILQNKCDLVDQTTANINYSNIKAFTNGTVAENSPVIPISAQRNLNIDALCQMLCKIPMPHRNFDAVPLLRVVRSFDINKPGIGISAINGGVAGGTLKQGILKLGQQIEIRPGIIKRDLKTRKIQSYPLVSEITSLFSEETNLEFAIPGGLIGVGTNLDPHITMKDRLVGQLLGPVGELPPVYQHIVVTAHLMKLVVLSGTEKKVKSLKLDEILKINCNGFNSKAKITSIQSKLVTMELEVVSCIEPDSRISLSRCFDGEFRLIGFGIFKYGEETLICYDI